MKHSQRCHLLQQKPVRNIQFLHNFNGSWLLQNAQRSVDFPLLLFARLYVHQLFSEISLKSKSLRYRRVRADTNLFTNCRCWMETLFDLSTDNSMSAAIFDGNVLFFELTNSRTNGRPFPKHLTSISSRPLDMKLICPTCATGSTLKYGAISRAMISWTLSSITRLPPSIHGDWLNSRDSLRYRPATNIVGPLIVHLVTLIDVGTIFGGTGKCWTQSLRFRLCG